MFKGTLSDSFTSIVRSAWNSAGSGRLLLAVSGGADSTALFLACHMAGIPFEAVHCNFNLRGEESRRDQLFVENLCNKYNVKLHLADFDTHNLAAPGESVEMTCRRLRYNFFHKVREREGFARIVLAHNNDDNIETFFLNALRGSGSRGLGGMKTDTGILLRPFLCFSRGEIIGFLEENNQTFILDSSNLKSHYRRNFLRNEVFPMLESRWKGFRKAVANTIEFQNRENRITEFYINKALGEDRKFLSWNNINSFPESETLIFRFILPYGGTTVIASEMHQSSKSRVSGKKWKLGDGFEATFTQRGICIEENILESCNNGGLNYRWIKLDKEDINMSEILRTPLVEVYLPYDENHYEWKPATREMKIKPLGLNGSSSVFKLLKEAGVPAAKRAKASVLVERENGEPVWIPGIKRSRIHLITGEMTEVYRVTREEKE